MVQQKHHKVRSMERSSGMEQRRQPSRTARVFRGGERWRRDGFEAMGRWQR